MREVIFEMAFYPVEYLTTGSKGDQVVAELRMRIISKAISPGTVLSENKLAQDFSVSRSPIREALRTLSSENLVRPERMGAVVIGIKEKDIEEIYDVRLMLESFTFQKLMEQDTSKLTRELEKYVEMMQIAFKYKDANQFSFLDIKFHEEIIYFIDHHYIQMLWKNLRPVLECLILLSMRYRMAVDIEDFERIIENHELMIRAITHKDDTLVKEAFNKNFNDVQDQVEEIWTDDNMMRTVRESIESE